MSCFSPCVISVLRALVLVSLGLGSPLAAQVATVIDQVPVKGKDAVIGYLARSEVLDVEARSGSWLLITIPGTTTKGWIHKQTVFDFDANDSSALLPIMRRATELRDQASAHLEAGEFAQAAEKGRTALPMWAQIFGEKHAAYAERMSDLGVAYSNLHDYARAEPLLRGAVEIQQTVLGKQHASCARTLNNLAAMYQDIGDYQRAEPLLVEAVEIAKATTGERDPDYTIALSNLAGVYSDLGNYERALELYQRALELKQAIHGVDDPAYAAGLSNVAELYRKSGDLARAEPLLRQAAEIHRKSLGEQHPEYAGSLHNLAAFYVDMKDYAQAEPLYEQALAIRKAALGEESLDYADTLSNLASLYDDLGNYSRAEPLYLNAMAIRGRLLGEQHEAFANSLHNLAALYDSLGDRPQAESLYRRALEVVKVANGERHPNYATCLDGLAGVLDDQGKTEEAERCLLAALDLRKSVLGETHPDYLLTLNNLGMHYLHGGDLDRAEPLLRQQLEVMLPRLGEHHPDYAKSLINLAGVMAHREDWKAAAELQGRGLRLLLEHVRRVLPGLSDVEQQQFLDEAYSATLDGCLSLPLTVFDDQGVADASAEWALNGKAVAVAVVAERTRLGRDLDDPRCQQTLVELQQVRERLAALTLQPPDQPGQYAAYATQMGELEQREAELSKQLGRLQGTVVRGDAWVTLAEVQSQLPTDTALVEIVRFRQFYYQQNHLGEPRYAAWLIFPSDSAESVKVIDLGPASEIEAALSGFQTAMHRTGEIVVDAGESAAEQALSMPRAELRRLILAPLLPHLEMYPNWLISPDASLWLVPWEALSVRDERLVIDDHTVRYLISGRDLLLEAPPGAGASGLVLADPDFDAAAGATNRPAQPTSVSATRGGVPQSWNRLYGTAAEARAVLPLVETFLGQKPEYFEREQALEEVVQRAHRPRVALLSTHGFFLAEQDLAATAAGVPDTTPEGPPVSNNPLLRCGLILAGANRSTSNLSAGAADGVLTGLEIVGCDFRGTELIVLSACETGLGEVRNGQGVASLRQAFQLAGAQSVVASLWKVPDAETAEIMGDFWKRLAAGEAKSQALRGAKLDLIERRRAQGAAHPYFWAAFTLTGQD